MSEEKITFEINGTDYVNLKKFEKQHKHCLSGTCGDKLSYSFIPTGMGLAITVKGSCGQKLSLGNFMDYDSGEYDEKKHRPLTEEDLKNQRFEEAVNAILVHRIINNRYKFLIDISRYCVVINRRCPHRLILPPCI